MGGSNPTPQMEGGYIYIYLYVDNYINIFYLRSGSWTSWKAIMFRWKQSSSHGFDGFYDPVNLPLKPQNQKLKSVWGLASTSRAVPQMSCWPARSGWGDTQKCPPLAPTSDFRRHWGGYQFARAGTSGGWESLTPPLLETYLFHSTRRQWMEKWMDCRLHPTDHLMYGYGHGRR